MATQRRKSSIQKRRSSMKRKYMKSRKVKGGLPFFGMFDKKGGEPDPVEGEEKEDTIMGKIEGMMPGSEETPKDPVVESTDGDADVEAPSTEVSEESQEGGKKKKRKGTKKKKKGSKKRKTAKKAKKSKKKKGKK